MVVLALAVALLFTTYWSILFFTVSALSILLILVMTAAFAATGIVMLLDWTGSEIDKPEWLFGHSHQFAMSQRLRQHVSRLRLQNRLLAICDDTPSAFINEDSLGHNAHHIELRSLVPTLFNNFEWDFRWHRLLLGWRLEDLSYLSCLRARRERVSWWTFLVATVRTWWGLVGGRHNHIFDIVLITSPVGV